SEAFAQPSAPPGQAGLPSPPPAVAVQPRGDAPAPGPSAKLAGYVEANYSYNFNRPDNGLTNFRGFDNRHNSFTLSNAVLDGTFASESPAGRLALQIGPAPSPYSLAEPASRGAAGAAATDASTWKYIQQAYAGWKAPIGRGLLLQGGIFLSPIGFEGIAVKDNWNWSRSNLFFGLPFYHTGVRATLEASERLSISTMVCNGWNSV